MPIRKTRLVMLALLLTFPVAAWAQDASAVLASVQKGIGKTLPASARVTAAGSGYRPGKSAQDPWEHYRIEPFTADLSFSSPKSAQDWASPFGFLEGAMTRSATVAPETLAGTKYQVLTFTTPAGQQVKGYVTGQNVLERTMTEFKDPAHGDVKFEAVYRDWTDFAGVKYPTTIIEKENGQLSRILIVSKVEAGAAPTGSRTAS